MEESRRKAPEWFGGSRSVPSLDQIQTITKARVSRRNRTRRNKVHTSSSTQVLALSPDSINSDFPYVQRITHFPSIDSPTSDSSYLHQMTQGIHDKREPSSDWTEEEQTSAALRTCAPPSFISCQSDITERILVQGYSDDDEFLTYSDDDETTSPDQVSLELHPSSHLFSREELVFPHFQYRLPLKHGNPDSVDSLLHETRKSASIHGLSVNHTGLSIDNTPPNHSLSRSRNLPNQLTSPPNNNSAFSPILNRPPIRNSPVTNVLPMMPNEQQLLVPKRKEDRKSGRRHRYYTDVSDTNLVKELFGPSILDSEDILSQNREHMHDKVFAILFMIHLVFVAFIAFRFGGLSSMIASSKTTGALGSLSAVPTHETTISSIKPHYTSDVYVDFRNAIHIAIAAAIYSSSLTFLTMAIMVILNRSYIQSSLCFAIVFCFAWGAVGIVLKPFSFIPILGIFAVALTIAYTVVVWDRIPLAAVNLNTSLAGLRKSMDLILFSCLMMVINVVWTIYWTFASLGLYDCILMNTKSLHGNVTITALFVCACMIFSYFWTVNILLNVIQVVTATFISTWWLCPDQISFLCSDVMIEAFHAVLSSFGSICFGSLVLPSLQIIRLITTACQLHGKKNVTMYMDSTCSETELKIPKVHENIDAINEFGFIVIGISDVGFISAGKKSLSVFRALEWIDIVFDKLIPNVLLIASLFISFSSGCFALVVEEFDGYSFTNFRKPTSTAFLIGSWIGLVTSSTILKLIGSAVRTIFICFAVSPSHLEQKHPSLSQNMRHSWGTIMVGDVV